ncbi:MAG TPA: alpha/beta fold hydrolase [Gemmatimonadaceae bacterium]
MPDRTPVLFLPGLLCDDRLWRDQADALRDVATPFIANLTLDDSMAAMAQRALALAPPRFALAALSMGGYVAFEILRQAPDRITRVALMSTSASPDSATRIAKRQAAMSSLRHGRFAGVTKRMLPQLIHPDRVATPLGDDVREMAERVGGDAFLRQQKAILGRPDSRPLLASIHMPTLVAVGDSDELTPPEEAEVIRRGIADASYHVFGRCGHLPAMEHPSMTTALLRGWLAD